MAHDLKNRNRKDEENKDDPHFSQDQNNIGTVGHVGYSKLKEGKGSFKKLNEILNKKSVNEEGNAENEENHSSRKY